MLERPSPGKPTTDKKAITEGRFQEIRAELEEGPYRWAFDLLMATGRDVREIRRFAQAGAVEALPDGRPLRRTAGVLALRRLVLHRRRRALASTLSTKRPPALRVSICSPTDSRAAFPGVK